MGVAAGLQAAGTPAGGGAAAPPSRAIVPRGDGDAGGAAVGKPGLSEGPTAAAATDDSGSSPDETPEGSEDNDLDIVIKLPSGVMFVATMDESDLVMDLKDKIMNHKDYEILDKDIRIIYKGRQLADGYRLMDYNMQDCAKVHVVCNTTGGGKQTMKVKTRITSEQELHNMLAKYNQKVVDLNIPFGVIITKCLALLGNMNDSTEDIKTAVKNLGITQLRELAAHLESIPKQGLRGDERLKQLFPMVYPIIDEFADGIKQLTLVHHNMYQAWYATYARTFHTIRGGDDVDEAQFDHVSFKKYVDGVVAQADAMIMAQELLRQQQREAQGTASSFTSAVEQLSTAYAGLQIYPLTPGASAELPEHSGDVTMNG